MHTKFFNEIMFFVCAPSLTTSMMTMFKLFQVNINYENLPNKLKLSRIAHNIASFMILNFRLISLTPVFRLTIGGSL